MINTAINYYKKQLKFRNEVEIYEANTIATNQEDGVSKLLEEDLLKIIRDLPVGYRTVFNLYVIEGYTHKEIGILLGISENTSKSQFFRARNAIRLLLQKVKSE
jgi:RNA polymerase sigma-70 factor (ECF subfamily)